MATGRTWPASSRPAGANRFDETRGVAPGANIISLKVLDAQGKGLARATSSRRSTGRSRTAARYNIRVINLSLGGAVTQSWRDDPICQAVERAVSRRHRRRRVGGQPRQDRGRAPIYGGITTPGISPYAITVGALNTKGTPFAVGRRGGELQLEGPDAFDRLIKPDLVAPGNKILSLAAPGSTLVRGASRAGDRRGPQRAATAVRHQHGLGRRRRLGGGAERRPRSAGQRPFDEFFRRTAFAFRAVSSLRVPGP